MTQVTITVTDPSDGDMAEEADDNSSFTLDSGSVLSNATASSRYNCGMYFPGVTIPQGSTINSATLGVTSSGGIGDLLNAVIKGEDVDNAVDFATNGDVTSRVRTTAGSAGWTVSNISSSFRVTHSCATVIQEIVNRAGWSSGNAIVLLLDGAAQNSSVCQIRDTAVTPQLIIDYTEPASSSGGGAGPQASSLMRLISGMDGN